MVHYISCDEVKAALDDNNSIIVDVRTDEEFKKGHINGSIHIPLDDLAHTYSNLLLDTQQKIICYCLSGSRSGVAATLLTDLGYTHVFSMKNGLLEWRAKKYELVSE